jgi:hypothetical protein
MTYWNWVYLETKSQVSNKTSDVVCPQKIHVMLNDSGLYTFTLSYLISLVCFLEQQQVVTISVSSSLGV